MARPEDEARENIDRLLRDAGWQVVDPGEVNLAAFRKEIATLANRPPMRSVQFTIQDATPGRPEVGYVGRRACIHGRGGAGKGSARDAIYGLTFWLVTIGLLALFF